MKGRPAWPPISWSRFPIQSWFKVDTQQGTEKLWLVFSEERVPEFEDLKEFVNERSRGLITDSTRNKAVQNFLTTHSVSKPAHEKDDKQTTLKVRSKLLVYAVNLEHH